MTLLDLFLGLAAHHLVIISLITPPTLTYKILRAGIIAPIVTSIHIYGIMTIEHKDYEETWGAAGLFTFFIMRTFELLVFWPAEENVYRIKIERIDKPKVQEEPNGLKEKINEEKMVEFVAEPIPPPWTFAKFWWASSLWWSWRGIGWSYASPLPESSTRPPFSRTIHSSKLSYIIYQIRFCIFWLLTQDLIRSYMNCSKASSYFSGRPGIARPYSDLTQFERGIYSTCIVLRVMLGTVKSYVVVTTIIVIIGWIMGWKGESWETWGNPPLYGGLKDIWNHPGLSVMWSRVCFFFLFFAIPFHLFSFVLHDSRWFLK